MISSLCCSSDQIPKTLWTRSHAAEQQPIWVWTLEDKATHLRVTTPQKDATLTSQEHMLATCTTAQLEAEMHQCKPLLPQSQTRHKPGSMGSCHLTSVVTIATFAKQRQKKLGYCLTAKVLLLQA